MSNLFRKSLEQIPEEKKRLVAKLFDITDQILDILERKHMSQKDIAERLHKSEGEISKWMKGTHNFTEETIAKIETALGEPVTITMNQAEVKIASKKKKLEEKEAMLTHWENLLKSREEKLNEREADFVDKDRYEAWQRYGSKGISPIAAMRSALLHKETGEGTDDFKTAYIIKAINDITCVLVNPPGMHWAGTAGIGIRWGNTEQQQDIFPTCFTNRLPKEQRSIVNSKEFTLKIDIDQ